MDLSLRTYQMQGVTEIRKRLAAGDKVICYQGPTGSGKTRIFSYITYHASQKNNRTWIVVHRKELLLQAHDSLTGLNVEHGMISPLFSPDIFSPTQVASIDTLKNRIDKVLVPKLVIVDEGHHSISPGWFKVLNYLISKGSKIILFTATPNRLDGKGLGKSCGGLCDSLIMGPQPQELIDQGFLARPRLYTPFLATPENLHTKFGDFNKDEVDGMMDRPAIIGDAVKHYKDICHSQPNIVFVPSLKMAAHVEEQYRAAGFQAAMVDGKMDDKERKGRITALGTGGLHVLISCQLIDEGVDVPIVRCIQMLNPTKSLGRFLQQSGRGARMSPGKDSYFLLDHVCNTFYPGMRTNHGDPSWDRIWTLDGEDRKAKKKKEDQEIKVRQCPDCYGTHYFALRCPYCGHVYETSHRSIEQVDGTLHEVDEMAAERARKIEELRRKEFQKKEERMCRTLEDFQAIARARGYNEKWALIRWNMRKGRTSSGPRLPGV